jgi:hypothetical protein
MVWSGPLSLYYVFCWSTTIEQITDGWDHRLSIIFLLQPARRRPAPRSAPFSSPWTPQQRVVMPPIKPWPGKRPAKSPQNRHHLMIQQKLWQNVLWNVFQKISTTCWKSILTLAYLYDNRFVLTIRLWFEVDHCLTIMSFSGLLLLNK